jgi:hypothetical protein
VTTTALAVWNPDLIDAGRGLCRDRRWLVSRRSATRARWLSGWNQDLACLAWNVAVVTAGWFRPRLARLARWMVAPSRAQYPAYAGAAAVAVLVHIVPVALVAVTVAALVAVFARLTEGVGVQEVAR